MTNIVRWSGPQLRVLTVSVKGIWPWSPFFLLLIVEPFDACFFWSFTRESIWSISPFRWKRGLVYYVWWRVVWWLGGWVLASLELDTRFLLRGSLHRRRVSKFPRLPILFFLSSWEFPRLPILGFFRALEPDNPGTVNQWTNENVDTHTRATRNQGFFVRSLLETSFARIKFERVSINTNFSIFGCYAAFANRNTCLEQPLKMVLIKR